MPVFIYIYTSFFFCLYFSLYPFLSFFLSFNLPPFLWTPNFVFPSLFISYTCARVCIAVNVQFLIFSLCQVAGVSYDWLRYFATWQLDFFSLLLLAFCPVGNWWDFSARSVSGSHDSTAKRFSLTPGGWMAGDNEFFDDMSTTKTTTTTTTTTTTRTTTMRRTRMTTTTTMSSS